MAYLNLHLDYFDHPKTKRLIGLLGKGAEVIPIRVWAYCGKYHARDEKLAGYSAQEIESVIGWWGEEGKAIEALLKVGFIEKKDNQYVVCDWHIIAQKIISELNQNNRPKKSLWEQIKAKIFLRDDYTCQYCKKRGGNLECDHILPVSRGGDSSEKNLNTSCSKCNREKGNKTLTEWRKVYGMD